MKCKKCGSERIQMVAETKGKTKHRGCLGWFLWILLAICTFGLILIIPLITNSKTKITTKTKAICMDCGKEWYI